MSLALRLEALLPQTQCTQCGFDGCRPYAQALAENRAEPNLCPPGDDAVAEALAAVLGRAPQPLDPDHAYRAPSVAVVDEAACIGCTKCIQACPVDAIVGASKMMHTVIASWCTGCELCVPPCPVDCITLEPAAALPPAKLSRLRHEQRAIRIERDAAERDARLAAYE